MSIIAKGNVSAFREQEVCNEEIGLQGGVE